MDSKMSKESCGKIRRLPVPVPGSGLQFKIYYRQAFKVILLKCLVTIKLILHTYGVIKNYFHCS